MPDLHGWITQQITATEAVANAATPGPWAADEEDESVRADAGTVARMRDHNRLASWVQIQADMQLITGHADPATVLRRCAADRKILERHRLNPDAYWAEAAMCQGCGTEDEMAYPRTENLNDCPELLDLAEAHGLTPEQLASLNRPQPGERPEPGPRSPILDALYGNLIATFFATRPVEPSPKEKAIKILGPELKKISGYVPMGEEQQ